MIEYDEKKGAVRWKADLLFPLGRDELTGQAEVLDALRKFAAIVNSEAAAGFDVILVGHTCNMPIVQPETAAKHPTNWHLASHRAIAVLEVMSRNGIAPERLSTRGFGEFRPAVPPKPKKIGTPENRRVEIYIVPQGM